MFKYTSTWFRNQTDGRVGSWRRSGKRRNGRKSGRRSGKRKSGDSCPPPKIVVKRHFFGVADND